MPNKSAVKITASNVWVARGGTRIPLVPSTRASVNRQATSAVPAPTLVIASKAGLPTGPARAESHSAAPQATARSAVREAPPDASWRPPERHGSSPRGGVSDE